MTVSSPASFTCPVMIGRERELTLLRGWVERADGTTTLLAGDGGIGKTRLVREVVNYSSRLGHQVIQASCSEPDRTVPYAPLHDLLREIAETQSLDKVAGWAGPDAAVLVGLLPDLVSLLPAVDSGLSPLLQRRHMFEAIVRVLGAMANDMPCFLVLEDLHWSDADSLDFVRFLVRRPMMPGGLLLTYRPDETNPALAHLLASLDREHCAVELPLTGLGPRETEAMLRAILNRQPVPAEALHLVWTLTEGNPFFVEELLKTLSAASDEATPGQLDLRAMDRLHVPRSVQDTVVRRMARLSPLARRALDLAAVAGRRFDFPLLLEVSGMAEAELLAAVKELVAAQLVIEESADRFAFRHALTRQAIYGGLLTRERQHLHRAIAAATARVYADQLNDHIAALADHSFEAGDWDAAIDYATRAGARAQALGAPTVAIYHFSQALEATRHHPGTPPWSLYHGRGQAYETLGDFDCSLTDYELARKLARGAADRAGESAVLLSLGLLWAGRDYGRAGDCDEQALAVARDLGDPILIARSLNRLGNWHLNVTEPEQAQRLHHEALSIFEMLGDQAGVAETLDLLGLAHYLGGDSIGGTAYYERAVTLWRALDDRRGLASSLIMLAARGPNFHTSTVPAAASLSEAERTGTEALAVTRAIGWRAGEAWATWELGGLCLASQGEYGRALEATRAGLTLAEEIEHRQWAVGANCMLGNIYAELFAWPLASQHLELALARAREIGSSYWVRSAAGWLASTAIAQGDQAGAAAVLDRELSADTPMYAIAGRLLWLARIELARAEGDPALALDLIDRLTLSVPPASDRPIAHLAKLRGEALMQLGRLIEAESALRSAQDEAHRLGARPMLWRIDLALGRLHRAQHRLDEAEQAFAAARQLIEDLAATIADEPIRAGFLAGTSALLPRGRTSRQIARKAYGGLTEREREVAALLTRGHSNREIAATLFLSEWTVATHVRNILSKLDLHSRSQIGAWALDHELGDRS